MIYTYIRPTYIFYILDRLGLFINQFIGHCGRAAALRKQRRYTYSAYFNLFNFRAIAIDVG